MNVFKTKVAELDSIAIAAFLMEESITLGEGFLNAVEIGLKKLGANPEMAGRFSTTVAKLQPYRVWPIKGFENYLMFYRVRSDSLTLMRVVHGARDLESVLQE